MIDEKWLDVSLTVGLKPIPFGDAKITLPFWLNSDSVEDQGVGYIGIEASHAGAIPKFNIGDVRQFRGTMAGEEGTVEVIVSNAKVFSSSATKLVMVAESSDKVTSPVGVTIC